jgi:hypothetical protein
VKLVQLVQRVLQVLLEHKVLQDQPEALGLPEQPEQQVLQVLKE